MKRLILPAGALLAAAVPAIADAKPPTAAHARAYERAYDHVARVFGRRAPGRNIIKQGVAPHKPASDAQTVASLVVLERMVAPAHAAASTAKSTGTSAGTLPACASESGTNYSTGSGNTNASSGATGRYQITPSTAANYGCSLATPAGQDACAQMIYAHQGTGAWTGCGG